MGYTIYNIVFYTCNMSTFADTFVVNGQYLAHVLYEPRHANIMCTDYMQQQNLWSDFTFRVVRSEHLDFALILYRPRILLTQYKGPG